MVAIPFPLSSMPGAKPQESGGRLINAFAEPLADTARSDAVRRRAPGLARFASTNLTGFRGAIFVNGTVYAAFQDTAVTISSSGTVTQLTGSLSGSDPVFFARNNAAPTPNIVAVCNAGAFTLSATTVSSYPDVNVGNPNSVAFQDGYFFFSYGDGTIQASGLNSTSLNTLDRTKSQAKPGGLLRVVSWQNNLVAFGAAYIEWYSNTANPVAFPFSRSNWVPRGLASATAVAGMEDGFGAALLFVGDDNTVLSMDGYSLNKVSPPDLDRLIQAVSDKTTLEASSYISGGHHFWQLSSPSWTWVYDVNNGMWHERNSLGLLRSRMKGSVYAFSKWLCGDTKSGNILSIDPSVFKEDTDNLSYVVESGPVDGFPSRTLVAKADFQLATGVGDYTSTDITVVNPTAQIAWSDDGGVTWKNPLFRSIGQPGQWKNKITVTRTGLTSSFGRRWRVTVDDPVYVGLMGGDQKAELRP
jgi:hypothetical protein